MTKKEIKQSYGICGLVCALCSYRSNCSGCRCKTDKCEVKSCCLEKGLNYCFECSAYPCGRDMHKGMRSRAFNMVAKNEGLDKLADYLRINLGRGITYHRENELNGDYDRCRTVGEVIDLLKNGKPDPYDVCPTYESKNFILRLVSTDDAAELFECYKTAAVSVQANSENCVYGYGSQTLEEMQDCIKRWLDAYQSRCFVRFSIIDKQKSKAVGTIEIFNGGHHGHSILRIDVRSKYENKEHLDELLNIAEAFFYDFGCENIVTKAIPEADERIAALTDNGYLPYPANDEWERKDYYIKRSPKNGT